MTDKVNFDEIFDQFTFTERVEKSMKEYTNWLLGISIGLGALLQSKLFNNNCSSILLIIIFILIAGGVLLIGYTKYLILNREIQLNTKFGELKKLQILSTIENNNSTKDKVQKIMKDYYKESNKLEPIGSFINIGTFLTTLNIIITLSFILYLISQNVCQQCV